MSGAATSVRMGGAPAPEPALVAPAHVVETTTGVVVDPSKVVPPTEKPAEGSRPAWLPEKFKSPEDLAKAYQELETKQGKPAEPAPTVTPEAAQAKGVDLDALSKEYAEKGALSPESLKALEAKGFTKAHVDAYVTGLQAKATALRTSLAEVAGGDEQLTGVLQWAQVNLSAPEQSAYNSLVDAGNVEGAKMILQGIVGRFTEATGNDPQLMVATAAATAAGIKPFLSSMEVVNAMNAKDASGRKMYATDPAYRAQIERRLSISNF